MRLTFPILTLSIGGAQRMLSELTNGLVAKGHNVTILMPPQGEIDYPINAALIRSKTNYEITEGDYPGGDFIISNFYTTVPAAAKASAQGKGVHIRLSLCYEPAFLPNNHLSFPSYHATKHVIALSKSQQEIIHLNHGVNAYIVPVGVNATFRNLHLPVSQSQLQVSAIVRRPEGGFSWHRDQPYLLQQLHTVLQHHPKVDINLFCPPHELATSPELQQIQKNKRFRFFSTEHDQELCYLYNKTDVYVSSSTYDSASLPGLEAMRCGAALVTIYSGGNQDYCRHEDNCLLSYRYENKLGEDIIRLLVDTPLRQRLAQNGVKEAAKWTWERSVAAFEDALSSIAERA